MFNFIEKEVPVLFPMENITQVALEFDVEDIGRDFFVRCGIDIPVGFEKMRAKRKSEYLAGRLCAQRALLQMANISAQVGKNEDRSPRWPDGFIGGSISHTHNLAMACVAKSTDYRRIGIDIEEVMSLEAANNTEGHILTDADRLFIKDTPLNQFVSLVFSAKESLFKAIYHEVDYIFDFADASLVDMDQTLLRLQIQRDLSDRWMRGARLDVGYKFSGKHVYTFVAEKL